MRIHTVEAFPLHYPEPHDSNKSRYVTIAKVTTADGAVGWGECIAQFPEAALATKVVVEEGFAPLLIGEDARDVERLWQAMRDRSWWYGNGGVASFAISAVDMALWDLKGRLLDVPVYELLGGKRMERMRACASIIFDTEDLDATGEEFADLASRGYTAVKGGWGKSPETCFGRDPKRDLALVSTIREAVGPDVDFIVDVGTHVRWTPSHAIAMARAFEPYNLFWIEEPLPQDDIQGYIRLRESISTPIATGEKEWTLRAFKELIEVGAADIVMPDPGQGGGRDGVQEDRGVRQRPQRALHATLVVECHQHGRRREPLRELRQRRRVRAQAQPFADAVRAGDRAHRAEGRLGAGADRAGMGPHHRARGDRPLPHAVAADQGSVGATWWDAPSAAEL